jgi:hypothetical protein
MRWIFSIVAIVLLAWAAFLASPFVGLYRLAKAVEARDAAAIEERVNMAEVRAHLTHQLVQAYLKAVAKGRPLGGFDRQIAAQAGSTLVDPLLDQLVTPEALIDLLDDGWPQKVVPPAASAQQPLRFDLGSFGRAWRLFVTSETRGFRKVLISLPHSRPPEERFRLMMRLTGTTWRLAYLDLPHELLENLVKRLPHGSASAL